MLCSPYSLVFLSGIFLSSLLPSETLQFNGGVIVWKELALPRHSDPDKLTHAKGQVVGPEAPQGVFGLLWRDIRIESPRGNEGGPEARRQIPPPWYDPSFLGGFIFGHCYTSLL